MLFHFWFLFILCLFSCYCNQKCNDNVIKYSISQCNENLSQNVIVSNPNECDVNNYTFPKSLIGIKCTECKKGTHLAYNYHNKQMECHICPYNTYSTGSLFRINGKYNEWNSHSLDSFLNNCYVVGNNNEENQFCEGYTISNDHSTLITSNPNIKEYLGKLYVAQLSLSISIIKEGYIKFNYRKNTVKEKGKINGIFRFFINYLIEINDNADNSENEYKEVYYLLKPGRYSFLFQYLKNINSVESENMKLSIEYIEIEGSKVASLECISCENGISNPGSDHCDKCGKEQYFDLTLQQCKQCPEGKIGSHNGVGIESCVPIKECTKNNYYKKYSPLCNKQTNKQEVSYSLLTSDCIEKEKPSNEYIECEICPKGKYWKKSTDNETLYSCEYCPLGTYTSQDNQNQCIKCDGSSQTVAYYLAEKERNFDSDIEIVHYSGIIQIQFTIIDSLKDPLLFIFIDGSLVQYIKTNNTILVDLPIGKHSIKIRSDNILIKTISISNDINGGAINCQNCESGKLVLENDIYICKECEAGSYYVPAKKSCAKCNEGFFKYEIGNKNECKQCPMFTYSNKERTQCKPYLILSHSKYLQKYSISSIINLHKKICSMADNLCVNTLFGPIKDNKTLYYISFFKASLFESNDFTYTFDNKEKLYPSYIYMLEPKEGSKNVKVLKSLGRTIEYIKLVRGNSNRGIIIKYTNGDKKKNENMSSYLFLKCTKEQNEISSYNSPKFIKNIGYNFYFEWSNKGACPICLENEALKFELPCKNSQRIIYFEETLQCIITNITGIKGENIDYLDEHLFLSNETDAEIIEVYNITLKNDNIKDEYSDDNNFPKYLYEKKGLENCTIIDDYDQSFKYLILFVPVVYAICLSVCVFCYCRYRRISGDYQKLMEESNINGEVCFPNQQIELESTNRTNKEEQNVEIKP